MSGSVLADHITQIGQALGQYAVAIAVAAVTSGAARLLRRLAKVSQ